jgi:hypothetical protein
MRYAINHQPASSKHPEPFKQTHADPLKRPSHPPTLSHRQAQQQLALLLDETTDLLLRTALQRHVAICAECHQELAELREAEAWLQDQPSEAPEMVALEGATWADIQERLTPKPSLEWGTLRALLGEAHQPVLAESQPEERYLVPVGAMSGPQGPTASLSPLPVSLPLAAAPAAPLPARPSWITTPRRVLVAVLAASFLMTSFAALFVAQLSRPPALSTGRQNPAPVQFADVLNPGLLTTTLRFAPLSQRLFTLSSDQRFDCGRYKHCPGNDTCIRATSVDVVNGRRADVLLPGCATQPNAPASSFTSLFLSAESGVVIAVTSAQQVMTYNNRAAAAGISYSLTCCSSQERPATFFDQYAQLLLSVGADYRDNAGLAWETLAAQNAQTGKTVYRVALPGTAVSVGQFSQALLSEPTGWLYLWANCSSSVSKPCVQAFAAQSGQQVATWQALDNETPLAADPAQSLLYVRHDADNGQSETLALDARSGAVRASLPGAGAVAVNARLHHAYLLSDAGVTAVDTETWQTLSTLPVMAVDRSWTAPAVDEQQGRVYVPTILGKVLKVQDNPAGQLSLSSPEEQAVLNADRVMANGLVQQQAGLDPWQMPLGPGTMTFYYEVPQTTSDGYAVYSVPARLGTSVSPDTTTSYLVIIALSWSHTSAAPSSYASSPPLLSSYPYTHTWRYRVPAGGDAVLSAELGDPLASCC